MDVVRDPVLPPGLNTAIGGPRGRRLRSPARGPLARRSEGEAPQETVQIFLGRFGELFEPRGGGRALRLMRSRRDSLGWTHLEFQQTYGGESEGHPSAAALDVYGARLAAHAAVDC